MPFIDSRAGKINLPNTSKHPPGSSKKEILEQNRPVWIPRPLCKWWPLSLPRALGVLPENLSYTTPGGTSRNILTTPGGTSRDILTTPGGTSWNRKIHALKSRYNCSFYWGLHVNPYFGAHFDAKTERKACWDCETYFQNTAVPWNSIC